MKIVSVPQNGKEWMDWRGKGIGASDAPAILGVSPWSSPFELWTYKTGLCTPPEPHPKATEAMQRGHRLEPIARTMFEASHGSLFPSVSAEHSDYPYIRASLDGYNAQENALLEIKCPGKVDHAKALKDRVPDKYLPQLWQQFLVSGATKGYYVSWDGISDTLAIVEVFPPSTEEADYLYTQLIAFWGRVQSHMAPPATVKDLERAQKRMMDVKAKFEAGLQALNATIDGLEA